MYVVTGASGNTGRVVCQELLKAGKKVRAIARSGEHLNDIKRAGAEPAVGNLADVAFLKKSLQGATAVYAMIPPNLGVPDVRAYQSTIGRNIADAIQANGVKYAVTLSSIGAHLPERSGIVWGLYNLEQLLNRISGLNVKHLRPGYFMENLFGQSGLIKQAGIMGSPVRANVPIPMVATRDIGQAAVRHLLELDFKGTSVRYLLGARDVTYAEVAAVLGKAIGRPNMKYVEFPPEEARASMIQGWGASPSVVDAFLEFMESLNAGRIQSDAKRTSESTTPTSIEQFAPIFARAFNAS